MARVNASLELIPCVRRFFYLIKRIHPPLAGFSNVFQLARPFKPEAEFVYPLKSWWKTILRRCMRAVGFSLLHCNNEGIPKLEQNKTLVRSCSFLSPCVGSLLCSCVSLSEEFRSQGCCLMPVRMLLQISSFFFNFIGSSWDTAQKKRKSFCLFQIKSTVIWFWNMRFEVLLELFRIFYGHKSG